MTLTTPADEIWHFTVPTPAGTAKAAPLLTATSTPIRELIGIHALIPPGASGSVGWRITAAHNVPVFPVNGDFIVADSSEREWAVTNSPDSGDWNIASYNTGRFPHTLYLTLHVNLIIGRRAAAVVAPPLPDLSPLRLPTLPNSPAQILTARLTRRELDETAAALRNWKGQ